MKFNNNKKQCFAFSCDSTQVHVKRLAVLSSLCLQFAEKEMAPHSSTLAWKIPWTEEPGRLQSMGSLRVGHDWGTSLSLFTFMHWRRKWHPTPVLLPAKSHGQRSLDGCSPWGRKESDTTERLLSYIGEGSGNPFQYSCLENPRDGGAWWAAVSGVAQSRTRWRGLAAAAAYSLMGLLLKLLQSWDAFLEKKQGSE